jgi:hypothetical protein
LNPRPLHCERSALPTELPPQIFPPHSRCDTECNRNPFPCKSDLVDFSLRQKTLIVIFLSARRAIRSKSPAHRAGCSANGNPKSLKGRPFDVNPERCIHDNKREDQIRRPHSDQGLRLIKSSEWSALQAFRCIYFPDSQPDGLGYLNGWPLGPEENAIVDSAGRLLTFVPASIVSLRRVE